MQTGNCYGYMWSGAILLGRSYFLQDPPPFFSGPKNENFTVVPVGTVLCDANSQKPAIGDWDVCPILQRWYLLTHVGFAELSPIFYRGQITSILGKNFLQGSDLMA